MSSKSTSALSMLASSTLGMAALGLGITLGTLDAICHRNRLQSVSETERAVVTAIISSETSVLPPSVADAIQDNALLNEVTETINDSRNQIIEFENELRIETKAEGRDLISRELERERNQLVEQQNMLVDVSLEICRQPENQKALVPYEDRLKVWVAETDKRFAQLEDELRATAEEARRAAAGADRAEKLASSAVVIATSAEEKANSAETKAGRAEDTAGRAEEKANSAVDMSTSAETKAGRAEDTAGRAEEKATSALDKASTNANSISDIQKQLEEGDAANLPKLDEIHARLQEKMEAQNLLLVLTNKKINMGHVQYKHESEAAIGLHEISISSHVEASKQCKARIDAAQMIFNAALISADDTKNTACNAANEHQKLEDIKLKNSNTKMEKTIDVSQDQLKNQLYIIGQEETSVNIVITNLQETWESIRDRAINAAPESERATLRLKFPVNLKDLT